MSEDEKALIYNLRSLARMEHADLSIGDEAADAIERDEARAEIERMREVLIDTTASLVAAISLLERTPAAKKAAPSDTMFAIMLKDYRKSVAQARAALASATPHEQEKRDA
jgi:hypothetical protein